MVFSASVSLKPRIKQITVRTTVKSSILLGCLLALTSMYSFANDKAIQSGQELATAKGCAGCHGMDGNSMAPTFPSLAGQHVEFLVEQLQHYRSGYRVNPMMQPMATGLSDKEIYVLASFYAAQPMKTTGNAAAVDAETLKHGSAQAYIQKCTACHGEEGIAGTPQYPNIKGQHAMYIVQQLQAYRSGSRLNTLMQSQAAGLDDKTINALAAYFSTR